MDTRKIARGLYQYTAVDDCTRIRVRALSNRRTGLRLTVVHGIVRSLHGAIQIASEEGQGTPLQVLLPCAEPGAHPHDARVLRVEPLGAFRSTENRNPTPATNT